MTDAAISPSAERMRRHRERKREGLRLLASGRSGSPRGGEQSGSQHHQPVSFPLPPNACAVIGSGNAKDFVC